MELFDTGNRRASRHSKDNSKDTGRPGKESGSRSREDHHEERRSDTPKTTHIKTTTAGDNVYDKKLVPIRQDQNDLISEFARAIQRCHYGKGCKRITANTLIRGAMLALCESIINSSESDDLDFESIMTEEDVADFIKKELKTSH